MKSLKLASTNFSSKKSRSYFIELHAQCADEATIVVSYGKIHT